MSLLILYRPNSEHGRVVEEYINELQKRYKDIELKILNIDSQEGTVTAKLYDIVQYPAVAVIGPGGVVQNIWQGAMLPTIDDLAGYMRMTD